MESKYEYFRCTPFMDLIRIRNEKGEEILRSVEALRIMESSTGLPEATREMARGALQEFGLLEEKPEEEPSSETVTTIEAVKIYQGLFTRAFFAFIRGTRLYGSLSDLEKRIKKGV